MVDKIAPLNINIRKPGEVKAHRADIKRRKNMEKKIRLIDLNPGFDELVKILGRCVLKDEVMDYFYLKLEENKGTSLERWIETLVDSSFTERLESICFCQISQQIGTASFKDLIIYYGKSYRRLIINGNVVEDRSLKLIKLRGIIVEEIANKKNIYMQDWLNTYLSSIASGKFGVNGKSDNPLSALALKRLSQANGYFFDWVNLYHKDKHQEVMDIAFEKILKKEYIDTSINLKQLLGVYMGTSEEASLSYHIFQEIITYPCLEADEWLDALKTPKLPDKIKQVVVDVLQSKDIKATKEQWTDFLN